MTSRLVLDESGNVAALSIICFVILEVVRTAQVDTSTII